MKTNSRLFSEPKGLATALDESLAHLRPYNRQKNPDKFYNPEFARFKLWVHLESGKKLTRYSFDEIYCQELQKQTRDEWNGLTRLIRLMNKYDDVKTGIIYASVCPVKRTAEKNYNIEIYKYVKNCTPLKNKSVSFRTDGTLDLTKFNESNSRLLRY